MDWLQALILGLIQGLTEFLPVSSSGHLAIGRELLGVQASEDLVFEVTVHITMKYALVDGRIDTTVFKGTVIAVELDSVGVLVTIDLIDIDSHSSFIPPSSEFSCG